MAIDQPFLLANQTFNLFGSGLGGFIVNFIAIVCLLGLIYWFICRIAQEVVNLNNHLVGLEIIPPTYIDLSPEAFSKLFTSLNGLRSSSLASKLLRLKPTYLLEVKTTSNDRVSFCVFMPQKLVEPAKHLIHDCLQDVVLQSIGSQPYLSSSSHFMIKQFKLKYNFTGSLRQNALANLAFNSNQIKSKRSKLYFQITLSPLPESFNRRLSQRIDSQNHKNSGYIIRSINFFIKKIRASSLKANQQSTSKLDQVLFKTTIRLLIIGDTAEDIKARLQLFEASLKNIDLPGEQALVTSWRPSVWLNFGFKHKLPALINRNNILASSELASLFHFPSNLDPARVYFKQAASRSLASSNLVKSADVYIGLNNYQGSTQRIGLTKADRQRHVYILGGTGNGKTTMLEYMINQDIDNKHGLMIVDPHGDLAQSVIARVPKDRLKDVIYFNPQDISSVIGINLLELPKNLSGQALVIAKDQVSEACLSVFRKIFASNDETSAFRIERVLKYAVLSVLSLDQPSLIDVARMISDKLFRWQVIQGLDDESIKRFWQEEFNKAGDFQRVKMGLGPLSRLDRLTTNPYIKAVVATKKPGLNFYQSINDQKIIVCNLAKGAIGEEASTVIGSLILAKLELAVLARQAMSSRDREPFYLYVDEFQNYASKSFVNLFSESRKYGLCLTMAQQSLAQLDDPKLASTILDNVGNLVVFRQKSPYSANLLKSFFEPYVKTSEIANLARFKFYARLEGQDNALPVSGSTILLKPLKSG